MSSTSSGTDQAAGLISVLDRLGVLPWSAKRTAQLFVLLMITGLFFSPPLAALFKVALFVTVAFVPQLRRDFMRFFKTKVGIWFLVFLIVLAMGGLIAYANDALRLKVFLSWHKLFLVPAAGAAFAGDARGRRLFLAAFVGLAAVFIVASLGAYAITGDGVVARNPGTQGMFFAVVVMSAVFCALIFRPTAARILFIAIALVGFAALFFVTPNRSGQMAVLLMGLLTWLLYPSRLSLGKKVFGIAATIAVASAMFVVSPNARERLSVGVTEWKSTDPESAETSMRLRKAYWRNTLEMAPDYVLVGIGTSGFATAYLRHIQTKTEPQPIVGDPHNQYLAMLIEHGLIGVIVFIGLLASFIFFKRDPIDKNLGLMVLGAWCFTSMFSSHFSTSAEGQFIWAWLGVFGPLAALGTDPQQQFH